MVKYDLWMRLKSTKGTTFTWELITIGDLKIVKDKLNKYLKDGTQPLAVPSIFKISKHGDTTWMNDLDENLFKLKKGDK